MVARYTNRSSLQHPMQSMEPSCCMLLAFLFRGCFVSFRSFWKTTPLCEPESLVLGPMGIQCSLHLKPAIPGYFLVFLVCTWYIIGFIKKLFWLILAIKTSGGRDFLVFVWDLFVSTFCKANNLPSKNSIQCRCLPLGLSWLILRSLVGHQKMAPLKPEGTTQRLYLQRYIFPAGDLLTSYEFAILYNHVVGCR